MAGSLKRVRSPSRELERELVLAFQAGDRAAYESIDRSCRPAAERICRRLLINPADVEEAVQETMVRAYQGLPRFNGSYALKAWVARIATNVCLDTLRARSRRPQTGGTLEPSVDAPNGHDGNGHSDDPEELLEQAAEAEDVRQVLAALPERHRTALVLREFEGLSHRKIAEMLDTSPQRVKALIHRAKAGFRRAWKDDKGSRLAAFAPLLIPINWVRRLLGRAPEFDHPVAATTANAAQVASTPVMQSVINVASERMSAAMAAVMVAGTVGFAVQTTQEPSRAEEPPVVVEIVQAPIEEPEAKPDIVVEDKSKRPRPEEAVPSPTVAPSPAAEVEEEASLEEPDEKAPQSPSASPSPAGPPAPPPYSAAFIASGFSSADQCGCGPFALTASTLHGNPGEQISFVQTLSGAVEDGEGDNAWDSQVSLDGNTGTASLKAAFRLFTPRGTYDYDGSAALTGAAEEQGVWRYVFEGTFSVRSGPGGFDQVPRSGTLRAEMSWHVNGTPVRTSLTLA